MPEIRNGADLAKFLKIHPKIYKDIDLNGWVPAQINPYEFFTEKEIFKRDIAGEIIPVTEGKYRTGDIWVDICYCYAYLYLGKSPDKRDLVYVIGTEVDNLGHVLIGKIYDKKETEENIKTIFNFDSRIFSYKEKTIIYHDEWYLMNMLKN